MTDSPHVTASSARSPFAGCAIFVTAVLVMVFLVVFSVVTLFRQSAEIAKFTQPQANPVEVTPLDHQEARLNALAEKLEIFRQRMAADDVAELSLTPEEINLAIAAFDPLKDLRGTFRVIEGRDEALHIGISFPLNGRPRLARSGEKGWFASDLRYLNGTLVAKPVLLQREVGLQLEGIHVPGAKVPEEFVTRMSPYRITERYMMDPVIGPLMAGLTDVRVEDGRLVFARIPGSKPPGWVGKNEVDAARRRFFLILGGVALFAVGIIAITRFVGVRRTRNRA